MKNIILFVLISFTFIKGFSQVPESFKYQALIRNTEGTILANQTVNIRTAIVSGNFDGVTVFSETHIVNTNAFGLVNLNIGEGLTDYGNFSTIEWGNNSYFLKIEVDTQGGEMFEFMGITQLLSVPYALVAKRTMEINHDNDPQNEMQTLNYSNGNLSISGKNTVFIDINDEDHFVDNEAISSLTLNGNKLEIKEGNQLHSIDLSNLAGLQSLSFDNTTKILTLENGGSIDLSVLYNDADSVKTNELINHFFLDGYLLKILESGNEHSVDLSFLADNQNLTYDENTHILKIEGGNQINLSPLINDADFDPQNEFQNLSISGSTLSISNGNSIQVEQALSVSDFDGDTKIELEENPNDNVIRLYSNGIEVLKISKDAVLEFLTSNTRIGNSAGKLITSGILNTLLGFETGKSLTTGESNTFIGSNAGEQVQSASLNTFVGFNAGKNNLQGENNSFLGANSGISNTDGDFNFFGGAESGFLNTTGNNNVFLGYQTGIANISASGNTFVGSTSGKNNTGIFNSYYGFESGYNSKGNYNTFIGTRSGFSNTSADKNTFIGYNSGYSNTLGVQNVFLGAESGFSNISGFGNVFLGSNSGYSNKNGLNNTFLGYLSGKMNESSSNTFVGSESGKENTGTENIFIGKKSGETTENGSQNIYIGNQTAWKNVGNYNTIIGYQSGYNIENATLNTFLGYQSGYLTKGGGNVFLGYQAGYNELNSNKLYIQNSNSENPLIYGEFDNKILKFNAKLGIGIQPIESLSVNGAITISNTTTNTAGSIRFNAPYFEANNGSEWLRIDLQSINKIADNNDNTKILVEQTPQDNQIRFITNSTERLIISEKGSFEIKGTNFFIGENSGFKNDLGENNIFIGYQSGSENIDGSNNLAIGHWAGINQVSSSENLILGNYSGFNQTVASKNILLGNFSGFSNIDGNSNVFIGFEAGYYETSSDKLYIQNSKNRNPLIYGDFNTEELILNGTVSIGNNLASEKLDVEGAIKIGNTITENEGTIRWNGSNFEGYTGSQWKILDFQYFDRIRNTSNSNYLFINELTPTHSYDWFLNHQLFLKLTKSKIELLGNDIFIGEETGKSITTADKNIFIGYKSGNQTNTGSNNVFIGYQSGILNTSGNENTFLGYRSGNKNTLGKSNTFIGFQSGHDLNQGENNVFLGNNSGYFAINTYQNVFIGSFSGYQNKASDNVFIGSNAGKNNINGSGNIFVGTKAGENETASNKLYISNSETNTPLIGGDFNQKEVTINNKLNIKEVLHLSPLANAPSNPQVGDIYLGIDNKLYLFIGTNGGEWKTLAFE